jgi:hypothetical protein
VGVGAGVRFLLQHDFEKERRQNTEQFFLAIGRSILKFRHFH